MTTDVEVVTACVVIGNPAEVEPGETVTKEGTEAAELELESEIVTPPTGAGEVMLTVPVTNVVDPPFTVAGLIERFPMLGPMTVDGRSPPPEQPKIQVIAKKGIISG